MENALRSPSLDSGSSIMGTSILRAEYEPVGNTPRNGVGGRSTAELIPPLEPFFLVFFCVSSSGDVQLQNMLYRVEKNKPICYTLYAVFL